MFQVLLEVAESLIAQNYHIHSYVEDGDSDHWPAHHVLRGSTVNERGEGEEVIPRHNYAQLVEDL